MREAAPLDAIKDSGRRHLGGAGVAVCLVLLASSTALPADSSRPRQGVVFRHIVDDAPLDVSLRPNEPATEATNHFHATGENLYVGRSEAIAEGKRHYEAWCQSCHLPDGSGRIGPDLTDDRFGYERTKTDVGLFEIIWAGGTGAMQPFRERMTQDEILKVIAYVHSLKR